MNIKYMEYGGQYAAMVERGDSDITGEWADTKEQAKAELFDFIVWLGISVEIEPEVKRCKFWDSGWCYHEELNLPNGCIGFERCDKCEGE